MPTCRMTQSTKPNAGVSNNRKASGGRMGMAQSQTALFLMFFCFVLVIFMYLHTNPRRDYPPWINIFFAVKNREPEQAQLGTAYIYLEQYPNYVILCTCHFPFVLTPCPKFPTVHQVKVLWRDVINSKDIHHHL